MANNNDDFTYWRSKIHALAVVVGDPDPTKGEVAHKTVNFVPYWEEARGVEGRFKVGYLRTSNGSAIKKLQNDSNVQQLTKQEFEDATKEVRTENGELISGIRAPY